MPIDVFKTTGDDTQITMKFITSMRIQKLLTTTMLFIALAGCASSRIDWSNSSVVSILPKELQGSTVALFPLDKEKVGKIETSVIENNISDGLSKKGIKTINPRQQVPNYFLLYDYASELGITANYEQAFLLIAYTRDMPPKQVYKAKLKINSQNNDTVKNVNDAFNELISNLPDK